MFKGNYGPKSKPGFDRAGQSKRSGKPSFGGKSSFRGKPSFGGGFSRGGGGGGHGGFKGKYIDPNRFICKAEPVADVAAYEPKHAFADFNLDVRIKANITAHGYVLPTPIQDQAIPHVLKGGDVVGIANTGTGKTAAFLLPILNKILIDANQKVLVIVPTRELAMQINDEFIKFRGGLPLFSVACVGGMSISNQISNLRRRHNFVFGTPGRLKDLIERGMIRPSDFATIVLDEADRMLDMGFINDMRFIMNKMPKERQTLFFSATITREIDGLVREFLKTPVTISVKTGDTAKNVDQDVIRLGRGQDKVEALHDLLNQAEFSKVLIFGRTKHGVEKLSQTLAVRGFKAGSIHGNQNQNKRQKSLQSFKSNQTNILVATDVAARGLDIPAVSHVINFDVPDTYEDYVHRIGRTGRAGMAGVALTFID